jgi:hypothetical protein
MSETLDFFLGLTSAVGCLYTGYLFGWRSCEHQPRETEGETQ